MLRVGGGGLVELNYRTDKVLWMKNFCLRYNTSILITLFDNNKNKITTAPFELSLT